jgi:hypothetical protein
VESMRIEDRRRRRHGRHTGHRFQFNGVDLVILALGQKLTQSAMIVRMPNGDTLDRCPLFGRMGGI